jgi:TonB family protein
MGQGSKQTRRKWRIQEGIGLSLLLHGLFVLSTVVLPKLFPPMPPREIVEISFAAPPPPPPVMAEPIVPVEKKQVVDQDEKPLNNEVDPNSKLLSAHNQVVKKQTVAANLGDFKNKKREGKAGKAPKLSKMDLTPKKMDMQKIVEKHKQQEIEMEKSLEESAFKFKTPYDKPQSAKNEEEDKSDDSPGSDVSQTSDYLKDVDKGMETLLSTREFVYYSFYARIRRQLNQHWGGKVREKLTKIFKEGRTIASADDKITKVLITLDRRGELVRVQVLNDSGIRDLDDAAVEAFKEAAPFPNPPEGIVESDGTIKIRWDFILEA